MNPIIIVVGLTVFVIVATSKWWRIAIIYHASDEDDAERYAKRF